MPSRNLTSMHRRIRTHPADGLPDNSIAVVRMHGSVAIAVKHNRRNGRAVAWHCFGPAALLHGDERGRKIGGDAAGQSRMYANRCVEVAVGGSHDGGSRGPGRQSGDIDASRIDRMVAHDLAGNTSDKRGFATAALLVGRAKPIPAFRLV